MNESETRVLIAEDHQMARIGLTTMLEAFDDLLLVGEATNGKEAIRLCEQERPHVVLMDIVMPIMDGIEATAQISRRFHDIYVIALTSYEQQSTVNAALQAGAIGYLLKNITAQELAQAIRAARVGRPTLAPEAAQVLIQSARRQTTYQLALTEREIEVIACIVKGKSNAEIAAQFGLSLFTVKNHVSNIFRKLGVASRTEAATFALQNHLVQGD
jgi:NarL family two-component system response regulator LiaR